MVSQIDLTFLGTGSAQPSATRNHQAMALRMGGDIYLFDCGEATQHQFQKSTLKMGKITHIFITHMHGDHCFGLGPLLCTMSEALNPNNSVMNENKSKKKDQDSKEEEEEGKMLIEIYGPTPLRSWIRNTLKSTYSHLGRGYRVHELLNEGDPVDNNENLHMNELPGENIWIDSNGIFSTLPHVEKGYKVHAAPIQHSIPSLGYVIQEPDLPGKVNDLIPQIEKNREALKALGMKNPMTLLGQIQRTSKAYMLPDGTELVPPLSRPGRQIVILGDTKDPSSLLPILETTVTTLLVHEATNALTSLDKIGNKTAPYPTFEEVEERAKGHGHSTPQMAGAFAKKIDCKKLILTHFSARYQGDEEPEALAVMEEIRQLAIKEFDDRDQDIYCARDLWTYEIKM